MNNNYLDVFFNLNDNTKAISPVGVESILSIIGLGATNDLLSKLIKLYNSQNNMMDYIIQADKLKKSLVYNNFLFTNDSLNIKYHSKIKNYVDIDKLNIDKINTFIEERTNIKDCFDFSKLTDIPRVVFLNILMFKNQWVNKFHTYLTINRTFYCTDKIITVPTMNLHDKIYYYYDKFIAVKLPFTDGSYAEFFMNLPKDYSLSNLNNIKYKKDKVELYLPKFKHEQLIDLKPIFIEADLCELFEENNINNISNEFDNKNLYVDMFQQRIICLFDENGAECKSGTVAVAVSRCVSLESDLNIQINFNRPFYYRVVKNNINLLSGYFNG